MTATLDGIRLQLLGRRRPRRLPAHPRRRRHVRPARAHRRRRSCSPPGSIRIDEGAAARHLRAHARPARGGVGRGAGPQRARPTGPRTLRLRPRLPRPARWMFRLVDAGGGPEPAEARIDQVDPAGTVNPVAGFLLPDHLDESLELFDGPRQPGRRAVARADRRRVVWEIAPGRPGPPDAGPQFGLAGGQVPLRLVRDRARRRRREGPQRPGAVRPSPRSARRCGRSTPRCGPSTPSPAWAASTSPAWSAGPIAVVRAQLVAGAPARGPARPVRPAARRRADARREAALAAEAFPVRLGELTRTDDGLLGFFVDDDFEHLHLVDRVVAGAGQAGRARGPPLGAAGADRAPLPRRPRTRSRSTSGQRLTLTLLMHPAGRVHLTSGRPSPQGARAGPGVGGARAGAAVAVGADRAAAHRPRPGAAAEARRCSAPSRCSPGATTPATWRDDPILAATQTACCRTGRRASRTATSASCRRRRRDMTAYDWPRVGRPERHDDRQAPSQLQRQPRHVRRRDVAEPASRASGCAPRRARPPTSGRRSGRPSSSAATRRAAPGSPAASATSGSSRPAGAGLTRRRPTAASGTPTTAGHRGGPSAAGARPTRRRHRCSRSPLANGCLLVEFHDDPKDDEVWVGTGEGPLRSRARPGDKLPGRRRAPRGGPLDQAGDRSRLHRRGHEPPRRRHLPARQAARRHRVRGGDHQGPGRAPERRRAADDVVAGHGPAHRRRRQGAAVHRHRLDPAGRRPAGPAVGRAVRRDSGQHGAAVRGRTGPTPSHGRRCRSGAGATAPVTRLALAASPTRRHGLGARRRSAGVADRRHARRRRPACSSGSVPAGSGAARPSTDSKMAIAVDPSNPANVALGGTARPARRRAVHGRGDRPGRRPAHLHRRRLAPRSRRARRHPRHPLHERRQPGLGGLRRRRLRLGGQRAGGLVRGPQHRSAGRGGGLRGLPSDERRRARARRAGQRHPASRRRDDLALRAGRRRRRRRLRPGPDPPVRRAAAPEPTGRMVPTRRGRRCAAALPTEAARTDERSSIRRRRRSRTAP